MDEIKCAHKTHGSPITVIVLFIPGRERPYPLIPAEDYSLCMDSQDCFWKSMFILLCKAQEACDDLKDLPRWTRALITFTDGTVKEATCTPTEPLPSQSMLN